MFVPVIGYLDIQTIILIAFGLIVVFFLARGKAGQDHIYSNLTMTKYDINQKDATRIIYLEGRKAGIIAAIQRVFGFGVAYEIKVTSRFITILTKSRFDKDVVSIPISMVNVVYYGYKRSKFWLVVGLVALLALIIPGVLILYFLYWRGQTIEVRVSSGEGIWWGYNFYKGSAGSLERAEQTANIINKLISIGAKQPQAEAA